MSSICKHAVLLVDDEPEILYSLQGLLRHDFELHVAESGPAALEILHQRPIHVLMTDQRMPGMTGIQLLRRAKEAYPDTVRLVFTGYADIKAVVDGINHVGLFRYITKPWDPDDLIQVLHAAAAAYDAKAEQQRLLADLRQHVQEGQRLVSELQTPAASGTFLQTGEQLLARLQRAMPPNLGPPDDGAPPVRPAS